jgi:RNA polymerase sigma factor (sigma-70 family)
MHDMGRTSDAELIEASRRGERAAFGELAERYQGVVCAVSYSGTRDRALSEDVAQETFLAAWRHLDQLRETVRLRSWLCGIARNLARKARRRSDREQPVDEPRVFADGANPFDAASDAETERVVADALARVPETYREVLVLYYHEQRSIREVAGALGISEAAAMQRLSRGRHYLADGVNDLVERALRGARTRRQLAASVLAALPALVPSPVDAASRSQQGWNMLKLALIVATAAGAGTTAVVVHHSLSKSADEASISSPAPAAEAVAPARPAPSRAQPHLTRVPQPSAAAPHLAENPRAPSDSPVELDKATIERLGLYRGPARGPADAPVTIVMFVDMKCPYCGRSVGTLDQLLEEYPHQLRVVVRQFPVHSTARLAAEATLAADAQGKFWEFYDLVVAHEQDDLTEDTLLALAQQGRLDVSRLKDALDHHTYADALTADQALGEEVGVRGTPAFFINGKPVVGAVAIEEMRKVINAALAP